MSLNSLGPGDETRGRDYTGMTRDINPGRELPGCRGGWGGGGVRGTQQQPTALGDTGVTLFLLLTDLPQLFSLSLTPFMEKVLPGFSFPRFPCAEPLGGGVCKFTTEAPGFTVKSRSGLSRRGA